jgi:hypothetical protein
MAGYGDDTGFTDWLTANGYSLPDGAPSAAVLRQRGSTYVDGTYGSRFAGQPAGGVIQEREWPRTGAADRYGMDIPDSTVPQRVIEASYHAAYAEAVTPGSLSTTYTPGTAKVLTEVKGIKWEVVGDATKAGSMIPVISAVEGKLAPLLVQPVPGIIVV